MQRVLEVLLTDTVQNSIPPSGEWTGGAVGPYVGGYVVYLSADHKYWDVDLPSDRFAYNFSHQETAGKSEFLQIYGRHPVLPWTQSVGWIRTQFRW